MKNLYLILKKDTNRTTLSLLKESAKKRNIFVKVVFSNDFDFTENYDLTADDGLYRISTDRQSVLVEKFLINSKVVAFYVNSLLAVGKVDNVIEASLIHQKENLPIIKTIYSLTKNKELLKKYVDYLGGFPLIIKKIGGSHGVGVMKIDSFSSLSSVCDHLVRQNDRFILRKYLDYQEHARLIVLGNKVISSIEYKKSKEDFRSNVGKLNVVKKSFGDLVNKIAVDSVRVLGFEFGGVDILIDQDGAPYIAEVNFPCYFPRAQEHAGDDISGAMIDFLKQKSKK